MHKTTNTKTAIVMRDVLYAPECPIRIIATVKLTKEGKGVNIQEQKEVRLEHTDTGEVIMSGEINSADTANVYLEKIVPVLMTTTDDYPCTTRTEQLHLYHAHAGRP